MRLTYESATSSITTAGHAMPTSEQCARAYLLLNTTFDIVDPNVYGPLADAINRTMTRDGVSWSQMLDRMLSLLP